MSKYPTQGECQRLYERVKDFRTIMITRHGSDSVSDGLADIAHYLYQGAVCRNAKARRQYITDALFNLRAVMAFRVAEQ